MNKLVVGSILVAGLSLSCIEADATDTNSMYRLYNPNSGEHFYTHNSVEKNQLWSVGWHYEGVGWVAPGGGGVPVFRLYNPNAGDHHYTRNPYERDNLTTKGWRYEGVGWYSAENYRVPLYRSYNPNAKTGSHHYTVLKPEHDSLIQSGWQDEGISWYGCDLDYNQLTAEKVYEGLMGDFLSEKGVDTIGWEGRWLIRIRPERLTADPAQTGLPELNRRIATKTWDTTSRELSVVVSVTSKITGEYLFAESYTFYNIDLNHFSNFSLSYHSRLGSLDTTYHRTDSRY